MSKEKQYKIKEEYLTKFVKWADDPSFSAPLEYWGNWFTDLEYLEEVKKQNGK